MPKILLIDDESAATMAMHTMLRETAPSSWAIETEGNPVIGLSRTVLDREVEIVIVDLKMPVMDGEELIERALAARPGLAGRIIVSTGYPLREDEWSRGLGRLGCHRLDKPVRFSALEFMVWELIGEIEVARGW